MNGTMNRLSQRTLIILIVILSTVIVLVLANSYLNKSTPPEVNDSISTDSTSAQPTERPPIVIIDAGHGGWEPGAGNKSINEKDIVLAISLEVENILKEKNIDYFMIRTDDTYVSLEDRVRIANEKNCKLFVSIHNNSFTDPSQGGILTTYNPNSTIGKEIAEIMQSKLSDIGLRNRAVMPRPNLQVLRSTDMPSILLEIGFISNKKDLLLITDTSFQQKCAQQIVLGIEEIVAKYVFGGEESSAAY